MEKETTQSETRQKEKRFLGLVRGAITTAALHSAWLHLPGWDAGAVAGPDWMHWRLAGQENTCFHITALRGNKAQEKRWPERHGRDEN